jgi:dihydroxyacetone kinase
LVKCYWFKDGFVGVATERYEASDQSHFIHFTSDSVQKNHPKFGYIEGENKISFDVLQGQINFAHKKKYDFKESVLPIMKQAATHLIENSHQILNANAA